MKECENKIILGKANNPQLNIQEEKTKPENRSKQM